MQCNPSLGGDGSSSSCPNPEWAEGKIGKLGEEVEVEAREVEEGEGSGAQDKAGEEVEDMREKGQVEPTGKEEGVEMEEEAGTGIGWSTIGDLAEGLAVLVAAAGEGKGCGDDNDLPSVVPAAPLLVLVVVSCTGGADGTPPCCSRSLAVASWMNDARCTN